MWAAGEGGTGAPGDVQVGATGGRPAATRGGSFGVGAGAGAGMGDSSTGGAHDAMLDYAGAPGGVAEDSSGSAAFMSRPSILRTPPAPPGVEAGFITGKGAGASWNDWGEYGDSAPSSAQGGGGAPSSSREYTQRHREQQERDHPRHERTASGAREGAGAPWSRKPGGGSSDRSNAGNEPVSLTGSSPQPPQIPPQRRQMSPQRRQVRALSHQIEQQRQMLKNQELELGQEQTHAQRTSELPAARSVLEAAAWHSAPARTLEAADPLGARRRAGMEAASADCVGAGREGDKSFGFVPASVVRDLDAKDWKVRAAAVETLERELERLSPRSVDALSPHLGPLSAFILSLLRDTNFKVSLTAARITAALVRKAGPAIVDHVPSLVKELCRKLGDAKVVVRQESLKVFARLISTVDAPDAVLSELHTEAFYSGNPYGSSWRAREEVCNVFTQALLAAPERLQMHQVVNSLAEALADGKDRVRAAATEALAVAHSHAGEAVLLPLLSAAMGRANVSPGCERSVMERLASRAPLPKLNADGLVEVKNANVAVPADLDMGLAHNDGASDGFANGAVAGRRAQAGGRAKLKLDLGNVDGPAERRRSPARVVVEPRTRHRSPTSSPPDEQQRPVNYGENRTPLMGPDVSRNQPPGARMGRREGAARSTVRRGLDLDLGDDVAATPPFELRNPQLSRGESGADVGRRPDGSDLWLPSSSASFTSGTMHTPSGSMSARVPGATPGSVRGRLDILKRRQETRRVHSANPPSTIKRASSDLSVFARAASAIDHWDDGVNTPLSAPGGSVLREQNFSPHAAEMSEFPAEGYVPPRRPVQLSKATLARREARERKALAEAEGGTEPMRSGRSSGNGTPRGEGARTLKSPSHSVLETSELTRAESPEADMRRTVTTLTDAILTRATELDWEQQFRAITMARRLVVHHAQVVVPHVHALTLALIPTTESLRSHVSKNALVCFREMFTNLGRSMDPELEKAVLQLAKRAGEGSTFLSAEADRAMRAMMGSVGDTRGILALVGALSNKSKAAIMRAAAHLDEYTVRVGQRFFSSSSYRDCLDRLFMAAVGLLEQGSIETRTHAKRILYHIGQFAMAEGPSELERITRKCANDSKRKAVMSIVQNPKGAPAPVHSQSRGSRIKAGSAGSSRLRANSLAGSPNYPDSGGSGSAGGSGRQHSGGKGAGVQGSGPALGGAQAQEMEEAVQALLNKVGAKDWRERSEGIKELERAIGMKWHRGMAAHSVAVFDAMVQRLRDGNSKVNVLALQSLSRMLPLVGESVVPVLNTLVPALGTNLGATNSNISSAAVDCMRTLTHSLSDPSRLVQHVAHFAKFTARGKPAMMLSITSTLGDLLDGCWESRPQLVHRHVVPCVVALAGGAQNADCRAAVSDLKTRLVALDPEFASALGRR